MVNSASSVKSHQKCVAREVGKDGRMKLCGGRTSLGSLCRRHWEKHDRIMATLGEVRHGR